MMAALHGSCLRLCIVLSSLSFVAPGCFDPDHGDDFDASAEGESLDAAEACAQYCGLIDDHCEGEVAQFSGVALCESACAQMPQGDADDELGNSVACRSFHAVLAAEGPAEHCPHAGPAGDGICGSECESFCSLAQNTCPGELSPFANTEDCLSQCEAFPNDVEYFADVPDGDSYACRLRHLTLATLQPEIHCSHVGTDSPVCFD